MNLKKAIKQAEVDMKDHEASIKKMNVDQARREKRLDRIIENNEPESMKQINDSTARLQYFMEKIHELKEQLEKAEKLKEQQADHMEELR